MSQSGPTSEVASFTSFIASLMTEHQSKMTGFASNAERVDFLKQILIAKKEIVPRNALQLMFQTLRSQGFKDKTQPIVSLLARIKEDKNFVALTKNTNRADYIQGMLTFTEHESTFSNQDIINILINEGFEDQYSLNDVLHALLEALDPRNNPKQALLIWFVLSMIAMSLHNIFTHLKYAPGNYARNFTMGLTTETLKRSIAEDNTYLRKAFTIVNWSTQVAIMFRYLPSLGMAFQYFPEMLDPKIYGEKAVHALEETFGQYVFYVLTPIVLLMSMYGPSVIQALLSKVANSAPMQAAHEFFTLMQGKEDADALLEAHPELKESVIVRGLNWSYQKPSGKPIATTSPVTSYDERLSAALRPD